MQLLNSILKEYQTTPENAIFLKSEILRLLNIRQEWILKGKYWMRQMNHVGCAELLMLSKAFLSIAHFTVGMVG